MRGAVVRGAGDVMAGQAPVNSQLSSTASLDTVFTNITSQTGELIAGVIGLANSVAAHAIYAVPGVGAVAGSFEPLTAPGGTTVAGYIGVEVPVALFAAATAQDEGTIAEIAVTQGPGLVGSLPVLA